MFLREQRVRSGQIVTKRNYERDESQRVRDEAKGPKTPRRVLASLGLCRRSEEAYRRRPSKSPRRSLRRPRSFGIFSHPHSSYRFFSFLFEATRPPTTSFFIFLHLSLFHSREREGTFHLAPFISPLPSSSSLFLFLVFCFVSSFFFHVFGIPS